MDKRSELFVKVMYSVKDGQKMIFTPDNVADGDNFLIFSGNRQSQTVTFHKNRVPYWISFDGDEPMRLEDVPTSFLESILKNIKE